MEEKKKLTKVDIAKSAVGFVVGSGAYMIASAIIKEHVAPETMPQKVKIAAGSMVLAMMVADAATKYTDRTIDGIVEAFDKAKQNLKASKEADQTLTS